jgi:hypothetical protein
MAIVEEVMPSDGQKPKNFYNALEALDLIGVTVVSDKFTGAIGETGDGLVIMVRHDEKLKPVVPENLVYRD